MYRTARYPVGVLNAFLCAVTLGLLPSAAVASPLVPGVPCGQTEMETLRTDRRDYASGNIVHITGSGYARLCDVTVRVIRPDRSENASRVATDVDGNFAFDYSRTDINRVYTVKVLGEPDSLLTTTTFTVSPARTGVRCSQTGVERVSTDKGEYAPEETVHVTGSLFASSCDVVVRVTRPDGSVVTGDGSFTPGSDTVTTDPLGSFFYDYILDGIEGDYTIDALGQDDAVLATTTFHDADTGFRSPDVTHLPNGWTNRDGAKVLFGTNPASTAMPGSEQGYANFQNNSAGGFVGTLDASIPPGSLITGIEVQVRAEVATSGNSPCTVLSHQIDVALSWNNGATYTAFKSQFPLTTTFAYYTLGGLGDTWGRTWTQSEFTNANFVAKVRYTRIPPCAGGSIALDHIQVKVYYGCATNSDCNDGNACNGVETCVSGVCQGGTAPNCNDGNVCTDDSCVPATGCVHAPNTASCDDGNACTTGDTCALGSCQPGVPLTCNDGNVCTTDTCNPTSGCVFTNNTASCDDGNACTTADTCSGGACMGGAALNCNDGNVCTDDSCVPATGCFHAPNTASCSDGNACTTGDTCALGSCQPGTPLTCNDGNVCTTDTCNPTSGCVFTNNTASCDDGNACTTADTCSGGACMGGAALNCNDGNVCTDDSCIPATGCFHSNNTASCSDGNACNGAEICQGGTCSPGSPANCDDGNDCTADTCNPTTGCQHSQIPPGVCQAEAKVTGGGQMDSPGGPKASFGFVAEVDDGVSRGHFNYVGGLHINGDVALVYFVNAATHTMKFRGTDTKRGCTFDVTVTDNGESGANQDMLGLSTNCGETQSYRPIRRGNIQWHPPGS